MREANQPDVSWAQLYQSVLRLRPILEQPAARPDLAEGLRAHDEFCKWLRCYLLSAEGVDEVALAMYETEAAVERENWHALWSSVTTPPDPPATR